jgi:hypothetical protein
VLEDEVAVGGRQAWPRRSSHGWTLTCVFAYLLVTQAIALSKGRKSGGGEEGVGVARVAEGGVVDFYRRRRTSSDVPSRRCRRGSVRCASVQGRRG